MALLFPVENTLKATGVGRRIVVVVGLVSLEAEGIAL